MVARKATRVPLWTCVASFILLEIYNVTYTYRRIRFVPAGAERVLFKTRNSKLWASDEFTRDFVRLDGSGARYLIERGVRLVGIDYLSIGDHDAHEALLSNGVVALEGVNLGEVEPGAYRLVCLPLKVVGSDGAPARALLEPL